MFGSVVMLIGLGIFLSRIVNKAPSGKLPEVKQMEIIVEQGGCMICHAGWDKERLGTQWPIIGKLTDKDASRGMRYSNMSLAMVQLYDNTPINQSVLHKLQRVVLNRSMPPFSFTLTHWKSPLTKGKQEIFLRWIYGRMNRDFGIPYPATHAQFQPIRPVPDTLIIDPGKAALGELLYHDTRLSSDQTLSCASCHNTETGETDNQRFSIGIFNQPCETTTLTTYNAIFHTFFSWDGASSTPEELLDMHFKDPVKMQSDTLERVIELLKADKALQGLFTQAYPGTGLTDSTLTDALVEYLKTLITPDSPFDRYLKGNEDAITRSAKKGYDLFKKYGCATCHNGVAAGGTSMEYAGIANSFFPNREDLRLEDMGHYKVTGNPLDMHRFKVPGLRNIEFTYPYFHNAITDNLRVAVSAMAYHQKNIRLTDKEKDRIVAFLKTLTGEHPDLSQNKPQMQE